MHFNHFLHTTQFKGCDLSHIFLEIATYSFLRMQTVKDNLESVPGVQSGTISELPFIFIITFYTQHNFKAVTLRQSNLQHCIKIKYFSLTCWKNFRARLSTEALRNCHTSCLVLEQDVGLKSEKLISMVWGVA